MSFKSIAIKSERKLGWVFIITWLCLALVLFSNTGVDFTAALVACGFCALWLLVWIARAARSSLRARTRAGGVITTSSRQRARRLLRRWGAEPLAFALIALLAYSGVFAAGRFALSQGALARYVRAPEHYPALAPNQATFAHPARQIGLYTITATEPFADGGVLFITSTSGLFDSAGFAYFPKGAPLQQDKDTYQQISGAWWKWTSSF